jgi:hypothetical protein
VLRVMAEAERVALTLRDRPPSGMMFIASPAAPAT